MTERRFGMPALFKRAARMMPVLILIMAVAFSWFTAWFATQNLLDSDASSEMVLANLLARQNRIVSADWFYSNELRALQTQLVYAPLFKIFANWHLVRFLGVVVLQTILLLCYRYLCRRLKLSNTAFLLSAAMLIMPFSVAYGRIVLYHTFYLPYVSIGFLLVGLFLAVFEQQPDKPAKSRQKLRIALLLVLSLLAGLNGVRQLMITMIPLLASALIATLQGNQARDRLSLRSVGGQGIALALAATLSGAIGYLVNQYVLSNYFHFKLFDDVVLGIIEPENITRMWQGYFAQFGYQAGRLLLSPAGILACGGLLIALYAIFAGICAARTHKLREQDPLEWASLMFITALSTMFALFLFTRENTNYLLYFIPVAVWTVPMVGFRLDHAKTMATVHRVLLVAVCGFLLANGVYNNLFFIDPKGKPVDYEGISAPETDTVEGLQGVLTYLQDNHFTLGYATFWNSNIITEMSNGAVRMTNMILDENSAEVRFYDWLSDVNLRNRDYVANQKVFVLLKDDEDQAFLNLPIAENANYEYEDERYIIFSYDNPTELLDSLLAAS